MTESIIYDISCGSRKDIFVFFFQAEDGIRDGHVTGVQTCALPIFQRPTPRRQSMTQVRRTWRRIAATTGVLAIGAALAAPAYATDEEEPDDQEVGDGAYDEFTGDNVLTIATSQSIENWNPFIQIYVI